MNRPDDMLDYTYTHSQTQATTGYFSCEPPASLTWEAALVRLEAAPLDDFLHQHCLRQAAKKGLESLKQLARDCYDAEADAFRRPAAASLSRASSATSSSSTRRGSRNARARASATRRACSAGIPRRATRKAT